ncbi:uncharacterized protein LOC125030753 [Penaeus chinensis]|uniref:uncharacterized protein LOC125030753 n=1 Tax=Penaeus chinensis TaxID=139456 RepID=UPI001FB7A11A|nr:uncharacterized protein LOC125030753 [Penaeus chinensis]
MWVLLMVFFAGAATCLEVEPPSIMDDLRYISYDIRPSENKSTIVCNYTLGDGQAVSAVLWEILKEEGSAGTFEWKPNAPATATGLLKDKVNLERDDSDLELTTLTYELSANYSCTVTADDGRKASAKDEILIIDTTRRHVYQGTYRNDTKCRVEVDVKYYPVFPQPTVSAGLYSDSLGGFYEKITNWDRVYHANGSVGFSIYYGFQINENTPVDAYFTSSLGVTKSDGTYISLYSMTSNFHSNRGCKNVSISENQTVSYNTNSWTCFGEPFSLFRDVEARVKCAEGFVSSGNVTSVTLVCESANATTHRWIPGDEGLLPEDLVCDAYIPEVTTPADGAAMRVASCYALLTATLLLCFLSR